MKKVGIITMFYNSINYGGVLQSYALQKIYEMYGSECYQIQFKRNNNSNLKKIIINKQNNGLFITIKKIIIEFKNKIEKHIIIKLADKKYIEEYKIRIEKFKKFRKEIPHTQMFTSSNIKETNKLFDIFICGSDQIWKPGVFCDEYALKFVDDDKKRYSYAASISKTNLNIKELNKIIEKVKNFNGISLREKCDSIIINEKYGLSTKFVLDPTLLLEAKDWDKIERTNKIKDNYIFCYILGINKKICREIEKFAQKNNLKIVNLMFANGINKYCEFKFGDYKITDADPSDFISLIKHSSFVFTDSFHASVFSIIYKKNFRVINRVEEKSMGSRLTSLLTIFKLEKNCINLHELCDININEPININIDEFKKLKKESIEYIKNTLK